ncbi:MAG: amidohydrolase [Firmicutes bacterium]|nr:amidohydrolase [Bacillota bacterium]MCL5040707.1 amidohydrolase [Bacillota bacterium]
MEIAGTALAWLDDNGEKLSHLADRIWEWAELGLNEHRSAELLADALEAEGFSVQRGVAGMPTAFVATWGKGEPRIGFLGEYDALPGLSQKALPEREELVQLAPGHGCGHNLLGVGALGGVVALRKEMEARGLSGTLQYFGCPAEENFSGKVFMAREGLFSDLDLCLTWHPGSLNLVHRGSSLALNSMNVTFLGRAAHAGGAPHLGRSALDAVELMNVGVNYLREHVPEKVRMHYVITAGGQQPNIVPDRAQVWYYVRAQERDLVEEVYQRVLRCAEGAAIMTETTWQVELIDAIYNLLPNHALEEVVAEAMKVAGSPRFGPSELEFAGRIAESFTPGQKEKAIAELPLDEEAKEMLREQVLNTEVMPLPQGDLPMRGSTDVGDVSWVCPTAQFSTACAAVGTPGHSWQMTAQVGSGIGHAGMIAAARTLAQAGFTLVLEAGLREKARTEFQKRTAGKPYRCAIPTEVTPAFEQLKKIL